MRTAHLREQPIRLLAFLLAFLVGGVAAGCDTSGPPEKEEVGPAEVAWSHKLTPDVVDDTQPLIEDGRVYAAAGHTLRAYDVESGRKIWETGPLRNRGSISGGRVLDGGDDRLFLNDVNLVRAFSKETGRVEWATRIEGYQTSGGDRLAQNETHLFLSGWNEVVRLRKSDGSVDLRIPMSQFKPEGVQQNSHDPVLSEDGETLYVPAGFYRGEDFGATEGNLLVYDAGTGDFKWGFEIPNRMVKPGPNTDPTQANVSTYGADLSENLVVFPAGQTIFAVDRRTRERVWKTFFKDDAFDHNVTIKDGTVYVGSLGQKVYALDLQTGEVQWQTHSPGSITTTLTVKDGRVYFCNQAGAQIWVMNAATGEVIWHGFPPENSRNRDYTYLSPLAVGEGHMINVGSKKIYALTVP